ncbi:MAG: hypothetical protein JRD05_01075 [Deltaproteobacteria bacterium]|nr:hypothetical protein [Deltaproteobacteria bacterium]
MKIAPEIQLYLDLQSFRGRGEEAGNVLFEKIIKKFKNPMPARSGDVTLFLTTPSS